MTNPNLFIVTTDWHVTSDDTETGGVGEMFFKQARHIVHFFNSLAPAGVINLGDNKDHYGAESGDELDNYKTAHSLLNYWAAVNSGVNATRPILPGNHCERADFSVPAGDDRFGLFDARFWPAPYHWTADWAAPQVRFIAIHANIIHDEPDALNGFFELDQTEIDWLEDELIALPTGYKAIICSHPAFVSELGNQVHSTRGGTELLALLETYTADILCTMSGHLHSNAATATVGTIYHISCPALSYTLSNGAGGFFLCEYNGTDTITLNPIASTHSRKNALGLSRYAFWM